MMKKNVLFLSALVMALGLVVTACGGEDDDVDDQLSKLNACIAMCDRLFSPPCAPEPGGNSVPYTTKILGYDRTAGGCGVACREGEISSSAVQCMSEGECSESRTMACLN